MRRFFVAWVAALGISAAIAQEYPAKPIRAIIPLTPGSGADIVGRILGKHLGDAFGQPFIFENRPGAGGQIGSHVVVKYKAGKSFPKNVIERAAELAAWYSKRRTDSLCPVTVTPKKFVRKPKGLAEGQVIVEKEDVVMVVPRGEV